MKPSIAPLPRVPDYLAAVRRRWWVVVLATILGIAAGGYLTLSGNDSYVGAAQVLVYPIDNSGFAESVIPTTERAIINSRVVAQRADELFDNDLSSAELLERVSVQIPNEGTVLRFESGAQVLTVEYAGSVPDRARDGANAFANGYLEYRADRAARTIDNRVQALDERIAEAEAQVADVLSQFGAPDTSPNAATLNQQLTTLRTLVVDLETERTVLASTDTTAGEVVGPASLPEASGGLPPALLVVGVAALFLTFAVALVIMADRLANRVRSADDLVDLAAPAPAVSVPTHRHPARPTADPARELAEGRAVATGVAAVNDPLGTEADAFRRALHRLTPVPVAVGGPAPSGGERSSLLVVGTNDRTAAHAAASLAAISAQEGTRTILVASSLRSDPFHGLFDLPVGPGLGEVLSGATDLFSALVDVSGNPNLQLLPRGSDDGLLRLLQPGALGSVFDHVHGGLRVVLTAPSPLAHADSLLLSEESDGVVVVVRTHRTSMVDAELLLSSFVDVGATVRGVIVR